MNLKMDNSFEIRPKEVKEEEPFLRTIWNDLKDELLLRIGFLIRVGLVILIVISIISNL
jgi:hypothetical protein